MEGASVPQTNDPQPDEPRPDDPKPDEPRPEDPKPEESRPEEPQGVKGADGELAHAREQIKSAKEELARLGQVVSAMERGDGGSPLRQAQTGAEPGGAPVNEAPASSPSETKAPPPGVMPGRPMLLALVSLLLAICIFGAAFASRYREEAKAAIARWVPPVSIAHNEASEPRGPAKPQVAQVTGQATDRAADGAADATGRPSPPAAPSQKETKDVPSAGATTSPDGTPADLAQSLKTIAHDLASINEKLDRLKSGYDQKLREQADAIQQLKTTQEQGARDNARISAQVQALQAQLAGASAKPPAQTPRKESDLTARQPQSVAVTPRPKRPPPPWRPSRYVDDPWYDPYW
jgi:hypothetical protein